MQNSALNSSWISYVKLGYKIQMNLEIMLIDIFWMLRKK